MQRTGEVAEAPEDLKRWMKASVSSTRDLEAAIRRGDTDAAEESFQATRRLCGACHKPYRNE